MSDGELMSLAELLKQPRRRPDFGGWFLDRKALCLVFRDGKGRELYDISLTRCRTSAQVLDWIFQIANKRWATDGVIAGLVRALNYYLHPQSSLCSFGVERGPIDPGAILQRRSGER